MAGAPGCNDRRPSPRRLSESSILAEVDTREQALLTSGGVNGGRAFEYRSGQLFCEGVPLARVAADVGTPCYVYSKRSLLHNFRHFRDTFRAVDPLICYAVKANSNLAILRLLKGAGSGFDIVSGGELYRLNRIGADPERIVFSGVGKSAGELEAALEQGILSINVESLQELVLVEEIARGKGRSAPVSFRVNPDVDARSHPYVSTGLRRHKFGIDLEERDRLIEMVKRSPALELRGLGFHIGSQILEIGPFLEAFRKLKELAAEFASAGLAVQHLDLGGGVGIPYRGEPAPDLAAYAHFVRENRGSHRILCEPGRYITGNAGALLCRVLYHKAGREKRFVIVDAAMNDLLRPALYQAYHRILSVEEGPETVVADVVGPVCESGDSFARERAVADLREGDLLALMDAGAYGFVLASNYNSRPRPAEVLVDAEGFQVIRRRETFEDLIRGE